MHNNSQDPILVLRSHQNTPMAEKQWSWDHLRYFLALAEHGTLSAAGRELDVSHSTVLRRIRAFEATLETRLFEHTSTGYFLTSAGAELNEQARQMKHTLNAVARDINGADQALAGKIVIATTDSLSFVLLPDILKKLSDLHTELRFTVLMNTQINNIDDREIDIAIRTCKEPPDSLIGRCVGDIDFTVCASKQYLLEHPLDAFPTDVAGHHFIRLVSSFQGMPFHNWLDARLTPDAHTIEVNNFVLAAAMCRAGHGITVLPSYMLDNDTELQALETDTTIEKNKLWILCHSDLRDTERVRCVRRYLFEALSKRFANC